MNLKDIHILETVGRARSANLQLNNIKEVIAVLEKGNSFDLGNHTANFNDFFDFQTSLSISNICSLTFSGIIEQYAAKILKYKVINEQKNSRIEIEQGREDTIKELIKVYEKQKQEIVTMLLVLLDESNNIDSGINDNVKFEIKKPKPWGGWHSEFTGSIYPE